MYMGNMSSRSLIDKAGNLYKDGKIEESLMTYNEALQICLRKSNKTEVAYIYNVTAVIYDNQGRQSEALDLHLKALSIQKQLDADSIVVANSCSHIGVIYFNMEKYTNAYEVFKVAAPIFEKLAPISQSAAVLFNNIALVCQQIRNFDEALIYHNKALNIRQLLENDSLDVAESNNNIACVYEMQGKIDESIALVVKALAIQEAKAADEPSLASAWSHYRLGSLYALKQLWPESFSSFAKSFTIRSRVLIASHPDVILTAYMASYSAFKASNYDLAKQYIGIVLRKDVNYKQALNLKGQVFMKQGLYDEAVQVFDEALKIDPGYGDAVLNRLHALCESSALSSDTSVIEKELILAQSVLPSTFDEDKLAMMQTLAKSLGLVGVKIILPNKGIEAGSDEYFRVLEELRQRIPQRIVQKSDEDINVENLIVFADIQKLFCLA